MNQINVAIADDHPLVVAGFSRLVRTFPRIGIIKEAANGIELCHLLKNFQPDVVLLDLAMPEMDGIDASEFILKTYPDIKVVVLTMHDDQKTVCKMIQLGVHAFVSKNSDVVELENAIYSAVDNGYFQNNLMFEALKHTALRATDSNLQPVKLTGREIEVITLICQELTYKEISERLCITEKTVHNHRNHIMEKIGAKNTIGLIKYALQQKYIEWPLKV